MEEYEKLKYDVLVIGAGAAGMRAAVAASDEGSSVCLVYCFEKARNLFYAVFIVIGFWKGYVTCIYNF